MNQMGFIGGSLVCVGNALDPAFPCVFKYRKPFNQSAAIPTDTVLTGNIDIEVLGYSQSGTLKPLSTVSPAGSTFLGRITSVQTVKVTIIPDKQTRFEMWGSLSTVFSVTQETGQTNACWIPSASTGRMYGTRELLDTGETSSASMILVMAPFRKVFSSDTFSKQGVMRKIPSGTFTMGGIANGFFVAPLKTVSLPSFSISETEITLADWNEVKQWGDSHGYSFDSPGESKAEDHPVLKLNWYDAVKYCNARSEKEGLDPVYFADESHLNVYKLGRVDLSNGMVAWGGRGYRLPTEAEWEYAARGGLAERFFPWGDDASHDRANFVLVISGQEIVHPTYSTGGRPFTNPVKAFASNGYGLFGMAGNARELCWDIADKLVSWTSVPAPLDPALQYDPKGPDPDLTRGVFGISRIVRGGSWADWSVSCGVAARAGILPADNSEYTGFRVVRR